MAKFLNSVAVGDWQGFLDTVADKRCTIDTVSLRIESDPACDRNMVYAQAKLFSGVVYWVGLPADEPQPLVDALYGHCNRHGVLMVLPCQAA